MTGMASSVAPQHPTVVNGRKDYGQRDSVGVDDDMLLGVPLAPVKACYSLKTVPIYLE